MITSSFADVSFYIPTPFNISHQNIDGTSRTPHSSHQPPPSFYMRNLGLACKSTLSPTYSRKSRDNYMKFILPLIIFSLCTFSGMVYGFNVLVIPTTEALFGANEVYSMHTSQVTLAVSASLCFGTTLMFVLPTSTHILHLGPRKCVWLTTSLVSLGVACMGVSVSKPSIAGFWLSSIVFGLGCGGNFELLYVMCIRWYKVEWGR